VRRSENDIAGGRRCSDATAHVTQAQFPALSSTALGRRRDDARPRCQVVAPSHAMRAREAISRAGRVTARRASAGNGTCGALPAAIPTPVIPHPLSLPPGDSNA